MLNIHSFIRVDTEQTFVAKWLHEDEYRRGVDAIAKSKRTLQKLAQFGANAEAKTAAEQLKLKVAEAEQQVKVAQAKHGVIEASADEEETVAASSKAVSNAPWTPYKPPKEVPFLSYFLLCLFHFPDVRGVLFRPSTCCRRPRRSCRWLPRSILRPA
jgi:hypothetical protein